MSDWMEMIQMMFSQTFMVRAFLIGGLIAVCSSLVGVSLVLKRYSMIGDGLSHVGFGALALATALNMAPLPVTIPVLIVAAFLLLRLNTNSKMKGDSAIAIVSSSALAIGVIAASLSTGMNSDISSFLFGSILAMTANDVILSAIVAMAVLVLYIWFYNRIFAVTFDEDFAKATGVKIERYNLLLALFTALIIVVGMRMMGAMLISSLIIFPAQTSMRLFRSFRKVVISSVIISVVCFLVGLILSFMFALPTGATIVVIHLCVFVIFSSIAFVKRTW